MQKFTRTDVVYASCSLEAPDGRLLCFCHRKKLEWYIKKGLGEWKEGRGPDSAKPCVRLNFEPNSTSPTNDPDPEGQAGEENPDMFYAVNKRNCCVVCGRDKNYVRHSIVPNMFR